MPKDTKTRYQGIYARHKKGCSAEVDAETCSCKPSYWSRAWDASAGRSRKTALLGTIAATKGARSDLERQLASGIVPAGQSIRVRALIEAFLTAIEQGRALNKHGRKYKPSSIRDLRGALNNHVEPAFGPKRAAIVRRGDVQRLVDDLDCSGSYVRTVVNSIHSLYGWAQDRELVDHDPASRVRLPAMDATPRERVATVGEMARLLAALEIEDALPFAIATYTTARRNEIRHLELDDVDLELDVIYLGADGNARKSRASQRPFPIVKPLRLIIRRAQIARDPDAGKLLCPGRKRGGRNSGMLSFEALQTRADAVWEPKDVDGKPIPGAKVGDRITPHECKHTAVSWLEAAGVPQVVISMLAGHALKHGGAPVTARYTHALPGDLERARKLFDAYLANEMKEAATG